MKYLFSTVRAQFRRCSIRFRRFLNKGYAAFASMHKQVSIGRVSLKVCDMEMLKSSRSTAVCMLVAVSLLAVAEDTPPDIDEIVSLQLTEVQVTASPQLSSSARPTSVLKADAIRSLTVSTIADVLKYVPQVDVRERGASGVQADISLRGCTTDQTIVMLNGINLTDVQTGHYSMDIPISADDIERIEYYASAATGLGAYAGVVNIVTRQKSSEVDHTTFNVRLTGGEYGLFNPYMSAAYQKANLYSYTSASYNQSTGYIQNTDYYIANAYSSLNINSLHLQAGLQFKNAGANSFYSLAYPNQFDATRTAFVSAAYNKLFSKHWQLEADISYRLHFNRFELFRHETEVPEWYTQHNRHWTHHTNLDIKATYLTSFSASSVGLTLSDAYISSNSLGEHDRLTLNYFLQQAVYVNDFSATVIAGGTYNTAFGHDWALSLDMNYRLQHFLLYANAARSLRLPTFTDLYYSSATQLANPNLCAEHAIKAEIGCNYSYAPFNASVSAFYRYGTDVIDWVKLPNEQQWKSLNMTDVQAVGGNLSFSYAPDQPLGRFLRRADMSYSFIFMDKQSGEYMSKYALDYLRHSASISIDHVIYKDLGASWQVQCRDRNGEFQNREGEVEQYEPVVLLNGKIYYNLNLSKYAQQGDKDRSVLFSIECINMLNRRYYDNGGILQPPHFVKASIVVNL